MSPKTITISIVVLLIVGGIFATMNGYFGQNDDQDWQVLQGLGGKMSVRTDSGIYQLKFATAWTYPKIQRVYFSSDIREGSATDESCKVVFSDKGTASFSTMVLYRPPYMYAGLAIPDMKEDGTTPRGLKEGKVANFHRLCKGDIKVADAVVLARVKEYARITASGYNASQSVDNQDEFISAIRKALKGDVTLVAYGIDVEEVTLSDIVFDDPTLEQFTKQQTAILASKEAEAKKIQFEMEKLETEADYAQQIAVEKGKAEMVKMQMVTDAERNKELAEIDAQQKVEVALLTKQEKETKSEMNLSVAKIEKEAALMLASQNYEVAEIKAAEAEQEKKAIIFIAEGKEKAIELSGAITENDRVLAEIAAQRDVDISEFLATIQSPNTIFMGGGGGGSGGGDYFGKLMSYFLAKNAGLIPEAMPSALDNRTSAPVK